MNEEEQNTKKDKAIFGILVISSISILLIILLVFIPYAEQDKLTEP